MRTFFSEFAHNYGTYSFSYEVHAELTPEDDPRNVYEKGFLPRSNEPGNTNRCYLARSVRVHTKDFTLTSENRRVLKKFDGLFASHTLTRDELLTSKEFRNMFLTYFDTRHGKGVMSSERLEGILKNILPVQGIVYSENNVPVAYAVEIRDAHVLHYWYPVYDINRVNTCLGMWLMLDAIRRAKDSNIPYVYLGTAYGEKGKYKTNITPLEFWNGEEWSDNLTELKSLIRTDAHRVVSPSH